MGEGAFSDLTYAAAGVSLNDGNATGKRIIKWLRSQGMDAAGLFGGAVDVSQFKERKVFLNVTDSTLGYEVGDIQMFGTRIAENALSSAHGMPIAMLDYVAVPTGEMGDNVFEFVKGVSMGCLSHESRCPVIGGESAEMQGTYQEGKMDGYVHLLAINGNDGTNTVLELTDMIREMEQPLVVASTDGTGTKTKIIRNPEDIIYHGFNDVSVQGVKPVAFALYVAGNVPEEELDEIVTKAERISQTLGVKMLCAGKYVKEGVYEKGEVDIAGTAIGLVDGKNIITGKNVKDGDVIIGLCTDGLMTNGYSLARKFCEMLIKDEVVGCMDSSVAELGGRSFREELSRPHRPYTDILFGYGDIKGVLDMFPGMVHGMAHITGGGQEDNIIRMIPDGYRVIPNEGDVLPVPPFMEMMRRYGVKEEELRHSLNMGVGFTLIADAGAAVDIIKYVNENERRYGKIKGVERRAAEIGHVEKVKKYARGQ